jgi:hypothetical protein
MTIATLLGRLGERLLLPSWLPLARCQRTPSIGASGRSRLVRRSVDVEDFGERNVLAPRRIVFACRR